MRQDPGPICRVRCHHLDRLCPRQCQPTGPTGSDEIDLDLQSLDSVQLEPSSQPSNHLKDSLPTKHVSSTCSWRQKTTNLSSSPHQVGLIHSSSSLQEACLLASPAPAKPATPATPTLRIRPRDAGRSATLHGPSPPSRQRRRRGRSACRPRASCRGVDGAEPIAAVRKRPVRGSPFSVGPGVV